MAEPPTTTTRSKRPPLTLAAFPVAVGLVVPAIIAVADPWRRASEWPSIAIGAVLVVSGLAMVARSIDDHGAAQAAQATPSAPPGSAGTGPVGGDPGLVTTGLHAHSRNPGDLGLLAVLSGLAMASRSPILGVYLVSTAAGLHGWITRRREPALARSFPDRWPPYRASVPRWFPRPPMRGRVDPGRRSRR